MLLDICEMMTAMFVTYLHYLQHDMQSVHEVLTITEKRYAVDSMKNAALKPKKCIRSREDLSPQRGSQ